MPELLEIDVLLKDMDERRYRVTTAERVYRAWLDHTDKSINSNIWMLEEDMISVGFYIDVQLSAVIANAVAKENLEYLKELEFSVFKAEEAIRHMLENQERYDSNVYC